MEFEAVDEGRIGKILVPEGTEGVKVNQPIAVLLGEGEKRRRRPRGHLVAHGIDQGRGSGGSRKRQKSVPKHHPAHRQALSPKRRRGRESRQRTVHGQRVFASPLARRMRRTERRRSRRTERLRSARPHRESRCRSRRKPGDESACRQDRCAATRSRPQHRQPSLPASRRCRMRSCFFKPDDYEEIPHDSMRKAIAQAAHLVEDADPAFLSDHRLPHRRVCWRTRARLNEAAPKDAVLQALRQRFRREGLRRSR